MDLNVEATRKPVETLERQVPWTVGSGNRKAGLFLLLVPRGVVTSSTSTGGVTEGEVLNSPASPSLVPAQSFGRGEWSGDVLEVITVK